MRVKSTRKWSWDRRELVPGAVAGCSWHSCASLHDYFSRSRKVVSYTPISAVKPIFSAQKIWYATHAYVLSTRVYIMQQVRKIAFCDETVKWNFPDQAAHVLQTFFFNARLGTCQYYTLFYGRQWDFADLGKNQGVWLWSRDTNKAGFHPHIGDPPLASGKSDISRPQNEA